MARPAMDRQQRDAGPATPAYAAAFAASPAATVIADATRPGFPVLDANPAFERLTGYARADVVGRNLRLLQGPGTDPAAAARLGRALREGRDADETLLNYRKDGAPFWMDVRLAPVRDGDGRVRQVVAVLADASDRVAAETAQQQAARFAERIAAASPAILYVHDVQERRNVWANGRIADVLGLTPAAAAALGADVLPALLHPDDLARLADAPGAAAAADGEVVEIEYRMRGGDGGWRWLAGRETPFERGPDGTVRRVVGAALDVTDRRAAEQALAAERDLLRALLDALPDPIFVKDAEGRFTHANAALARFLGIADPAALLGKTDFDLYPDELARGFAADERRVLAGEPMRDRLERQAPAAGGERWTLTTKVPRFGDDGRPVGLVGIARDVSIEQATAAALRASEARYRALVEQLPAAVYTRGPAGDSPVLFISPQIEAMLGYPAAAWLDDGALWGRLLHPDDRAAALALQARSIADGAPFALEYRLRAADGRWVWVRDETVLVRDAAGGPAYRQGLVQDITARKEAEAAARAAEGRFRGLVEALPGVVYVERPGGAPLAGVSDYVSPRVADLLGYPAAAFLDDPGLWERVVHPDDRERVRAEDAHAEATGDPFRAEYRALTADGRQVWLREEARLVRGADGEPLHWLGLLVDITAGKDAEAALLAQAAMLAGVVAAQAEVAAAEPDPEAIMRLVTAHAMDLTGAAAASVAVRDGDDAVYPVNVGLTAPWEGARFPLVGTLTGRCLLTGDVVAVADLDDDPDPARAVVRAAGARSFLAVPLRHEDRVVGALSVAAATPRAFGDRHVFALRLLAELVGAALAHAEAFAALRTATAAAEEASRLKGAFLSTMSHELRTPLNAIMGYAHLLLDGMAGPLAPDQHEDVRQIARGADRLLALVNDVLDLTRLEAGRMELDPEEIDLAALIDEVRREVAPQAAAKGLALAADVPAGLRLRADRQRLCQVLANLVGNAVKFTETGSVTIAARATPEGVALTVRDTGIGIAPEVVPRVFDEFRQADPGTTRRYGGSGLGLAIVKRLVELHGGAVAVESAPGRGSAFTVRLPAADRSPPA